MGKCTTCNSGVRAIDSFKVTKRDRKELLNLVIFDWPEVTNIIERVEEIVCRGGVSCDYEKNSMLFNVINEAIETYDVNRKSFKKRHDYPPVARYRLASFIEGVINAMSKLSSFQLATDSQDKLWSVDGAVSLINAKTKGSVESRKLMYQAVTASKIQSSLKDKYEEGILLRSMDVCV